MSWPYDPNPLADLADDLAPTAEEVAAAAEASRLRAEGQSPTARHTQADAIVEAVTGVVREPVDRTKCPVCGSPTKLRGNTVCAGTSTRRCTNRDCRNEFAVASTRSRVDIPPARPDPVLHGGPYPIGPNRGGTSAPPIDPQQPIHRRLSEFGRRYRSDDE